MRLHGGGEVQFSWTHVDGGRALAACGHPQRKLEPTDVMRSPHAKKLYHNFIFGRNKK